MSSIRSVRPKVLATNAVTVVLLATLGADPALWVWLLRRGARWRCSVPTFIDRHSLEATPSAVQQQMHREAMRGIVDKHGVQPLAHWITDGVIYCVVRAPSLEALCEHHAERGLACDDVHLLTGLRRRDPIAIERIETVRAAIVDLWPTDQVAI